MTSCFSVPYSFLQYTLESEINHELLCFEFYINLLFLRNNLTVDEGIAFAVRSTMQH